MRTKWNYIKTKHFVLRQGERNVKEDLLSHIFSKIEKPKGSMLLVVSRKIVRKFQPKMRQELFIKIDGSVLITCFFEEFQDYLRAKKREQYLIVN